MYFVFYGLTLFLRLVSFAILVYAILSWIMPGNAFFRWLEGFVAPFLRPFRRLTNRLMGIAGLRLDISPLLAMVAISILSRILWRVYLLLPRFLR